MECQVVPCKHIFLKMDGLKPTKPPPTYSQDVKTWITGFATCFFGGAKPSSHPKTPPSFFLIRPYVRSQSAEQGLATWNLEKKHSVSFVVKLTPDIWVSHFYRENMMHLRLIWFNLIWYNYSIFCLFLFVHLNLKHHLSATVISTWCFNHIMFFSATISTGTGPGFLNL